MILSKTFSFRSFSKFCGCASLLEWRRLAFFPCFFPKLCAGKEAVESCRRSIKRNAIWTSSFSGQYIKIQRFSIAFEEYYFHIHIDYAALQTWNSRCDTKYFQCELSSLFLDRLFKKSDVKLMFWIRRFQ